MEAPGIQLFRPIDKSSHVSLVYPAINFFFLGGVGEIYFLTSVEFDIVFVSYIIRKATVC